MAIIARLQTLPFVHFWISNLQNDLGTSLQKIFQRLLFEKLSMPHSDSLDTSSHRVLCRKLQDFVFCFFNSSEMMKAEE